MMQAPAPVKQESGRKSLNIEISVDACAELGGQIYHVIDALRDIHRISGLRTISYVDTYQGLREKSNSTTPQTLFSFGTNYSAYSKFLSNSRSWHRISETHECKEFSHTLGHTILPSMTAPIFDAVEQISAEIRKEVFAELEASGQHTLADKEIRTPADVEIEIHPHKVKNNAERMRPTEPLVKKAIDRAMKKWDRIVDANPALSQSKENKKMGGLMKLIADTQECKAIATVFLYHLNPEKAAQLGEIPPLVTESAAMPGLNELRSHAHQFGQISFSDRTLWQEPEVQQAVRFTHLWPWRRKPYMNKATCDQLSDVHSNTADRAAISYFLNELSPRPDGDKTMYILVTHDGPLIADFIKFHTGIDRKQEVIKDSKVKGVGKQKRTVLAPVTAEEYSRRGLANVPLEEQPYIKVLTGKEFITFAKDRQKSVLKKAPMTYELEQAMETLTNAITLLEDAVKRDKERFGSTGGGKFAERVEANKSSGVYVSDRGR